MRGIITGLACMLFMAVPAVAKEYRVASPDGKLQVTVSADKNLAWDVRFGDEVLLKPSRIAMKVAGEKTAFGENVSVRKVLRRTVDTVSGAVVPTKSRTVRDRCNEMTLQCRGGYAVTFRVYDNGAAYRFETARPGRETVVEDETVEFDLGGDFETYWPREENPEFITHCEAFFDRMPVSKIEAKKYAYLPVYLSSPKGTKMVIMDPDLFDYPNLFLFGGEGTKLRGEFPQVILESRLKEGSDRNEDILRKADYIARTEGVRTFPWRLLIVNPDDRSLLENNLVWQLSTPAVEGDKSWIKPGKIAWDWWNTLNVYDVDFEAGVNTETYKYFIDFAAKYGIEYILLDEGWSKSTSNIKEPRAEVDLAELIRYGNERNVGVILWTIWKPMKEDLEGILDTYGKWGVKGIKIDFMQRSDQDMVNFYEAVAKACYDRELLVDFHGSYKPSGLHRKYPNVMSFEGVLGMEHDKDSRDISPVHDLILPFTRMVAGPMDYTPGATVNATAQDFSIQWYHPMSQGTRAHQAALYVVYESPLQMLCDSPTNYYRAPEFTGFIAQVPTVWDETVALAASAGEYLAIARRSGDKWFVAALTDWDGRTLETALGFLGDGKYEAQIFRDGVNADMYAPDYKLERKVVSKGDKLEMKMAKGGGWAAILTPVK